MRSPPPQRHQFPVANMVELLVDLLGTHGAVVQLDGLVQLAADQVEPGTQKQHHGTPKQGKVRTGKDQS